jgi:hypothetical protein
MLKFSNYIGWFGLKFLIRLAFGLKFLMRNRLKIMTAFSTKPFSYISDQALLLHFRLNYTSTFLMILTSYFN